MKKEILGVLGGMGPMATSVFFERVIKNTLATCDQDHVDMMILNHASLPDRTLAIATGQHSIFLKAIEPDFKKMEAAEVTRIAIPCNTSHFFYDALSKMTQIPIINMVEETVNQLVKSGFTGKKIGILATDGTIKSGVYKKALEKAGMEAVSPDDRNQMVVMQTIYRIKSGEKPSMFEIEHLIYDMVRVQGCSKVILACTELSLLDLEETIQKFCVDAMDVLVKISIEQCGRQIK